MTAPPVSEAAFQAAVVELATLRGWLHMHIRDSRKSAGAGFPDLVLLHPRTGELIFAELKATTGRVSKAQWRWIDAPTVGGHRVHLWYPADLARAIPAVLTPADVRAATA